MSDNSSKTDEVSVKIKRIEAGLEAAQKQLETLYDLADGPFLEILGENKDIPKGSKQRKIFFQQKAREKFPQLMHELDELYNAFDGIHSRLDELFEKLDEKRDKLYDIERLKEEIEDKIRELE